MRTIITLTIISACCIVSSTSEEEDPGLRWSRQISRASHPGPLMADWIPLPSPGAPQRPNSGRVLTYPQQPAPVTQFFPEPPYALIGEPFLLRPHQHQHHYEKAAPPQPEEHVQLLYVPLETVRRRSKYPNFTPPSPRAVNDFYLSSTATPTTTTTTTTFRPLVPQKQKPHQPPLAMFMSKHSDTSNPLNDVLSLLQNAKTIDVLDNIASKKPDVFVGPSALKVPAEYIRFDLPYLSNIEHNRVERRIDNVPFFVAPLSYRAPQGYAKIPFPSPHVGSVVVRPALIPSTTPRPRVHPNDFVPLSHAAYVTQLAQSDLSATERYNTRNQSSEKPTNYFEQVPQKTSTFTYDDDVSKVATRTQLDDAYPVHSTLRPPFESFKQNLAKTTTERPYSPLEHFKNLYSTVQAQRTTPIPYDVQQSYQSDKDKYRLSTPATIYDNGYSTPVAKITREQLFTQPQKNLIGQEQPNDNTQQQSIQHSSSRQQFENAQDYKKYNDKNTKQYQTFIPNGPSVATFSQFGPHVPQTSYQQQYVRQEIVPSQQPKVQQYPQQHSVVFQPQETPKVEINGQSPKYQQQYVAPSSEQPPKYQQQYVVTSSEQPKIQQYQQQYVVSTSEQPRVREQAYHVVSSSEQPKLQQYQEQYVVPSSEQPKIQQQVYSQQEQGQVQPSREPEDQYQKQYPQQQVTFTEQEQPKVYNQPQVTEHSIIDHYNRQYNQAFEILSRPASASTSKSTTEKQTTTTEAYIPERHTTRYTEFVQYQPSPTPRQPIRTSTHRPRHGSKHRGSQTYRDSIRQDYPDSVEDAFIEITKEQKPQNDYYDMKQYFKQQSAFHPLDATVKSTPSAENATIKYSLPPELPVISEMLPGLINSLQDATKPYEATTTPIPETTTQFTRRTVATRGRRPVPTRQYNQSTTRRTPVRRRPTHQTRTNQEPKENKPHTRYQSRYNGNNHDDITTESQRKSLYRQSYRTRTRAPAKPKEEEDEKPNYPDPLPVKVTAAPVVNTEEALRNTEPLYKNPETRVDEYNVEDVPVTTEVLPIQQYSSPSYDSVSKSDATVMIVTPSTVDAIKYTPQLDASGQNEEILESTSPSSDNNEEQEVVTEVYGFTREPNFPPVLEEKYKSVESVDEVPSIYSNEDKLTTSTRRSNFLRRTSRLTTTVSPISSEVTTEYVDRSGKYTVRPNRKPYTSTPVARVVKIRGRIRKPSTTTTEKVDNEVIDSTPKPVIHRFISRPRISTASDEITDSPISSFRITVDPSEDQNNYESIRRSHYVNLDTAESQWSTKLNQNSFQPVDKETKSSDVSKSIQKNEEVEIVTAGGMDTFLFTVTPEPPRTTSTSEMGFMELLKDVAEELSNSTNDTNSTEDEHTQKPMRKRGYWRRIRVKPAQEDALVASESQNVPNTYLNNLAVPEKNMNTKTEQKHFDTLFSTTERPIQTTTMLDTTLAPLSHESTISPATIEDATALPTENIARIGEENHSEVTENIQTEVSSTVVPIMKRIEDILHVINLDNVDNLGDLTLATSPEAQTTEPTMPVTEADPIGSAIVVTSTSTVITHETEICYRGRCVKNNKSHKN